ncbi:MAG: hypothetical protein V4850_31415 [Myxococcota bacterium]
MKRSRPLAENHQAYAAGAADAPVQAGVPSAADNAGAAVGAG